MKTITAVILLALLFCAGCASRYNITLTNGEVITAKGKPRYDQNRGIWLYTDATGKPARIPGGRVTEVAPRSMADDDTPKFTSSVHKL